MNTNYDDFLRQGNFLFDTEQSKLLRFCKEHKLDIWKIKVDDDRIVRPATDNKNPNGMVFPVDNITFNPTHVQRVYYDDLDLGYLFKVRKDPVVRDVQINIIEYNYRGPVVRSLEDSFNLVKRDSCATSRFIKQNKDDIKFFDDLKFLETPVDEHTISGNKFKITYSGDIVYYRGTVPINHVLPEQEVNGSANKRKYTFYINKLVESGLQMLKYYISSTPYFAFNISKIETRYDTLVFYYTNGTFMVTEKDGEFIMEITSTYKEQKIVSMVEQMFSDFYQQDLTGLYTSLDNFNSKPANVEPSVFQPGYARQCQKGNQSSIVDKYVYASYTKEFLENKDMVRVVVPEVGERVAYRFPGVVANKTYRMVSHWYSCFERDRMELSLKSVETKGYLLSFLPCCYKNSEKTVGDIVEYYKTGLTEKKTSKDKQVITTRKFVKGMQKGNVEVTLMHTLSKVLDVRNPKDSITRRSGMPEHGVPGYSYKSSIMSFARAVTGEFHFLIGTKLYNNNGDLVVDFLKEYYLAEHLVDKERFVKAFSSNVPIGYVLPILEKAFNTYTVIFRWADENHDTTIYPRGRVGLNRYIDDGTGSNKTIMILELLGAEKDASDVYEYEYICVDDNSLFFGPKADALRRLEDTFVYSKKLVPMVKGEVVRGMVDRIDGDYITPTIPTFQEPGANPIYERSVSMDLVGGENRNMLNEVQRWKVPQVIDLNAVKVAEQVSKYLYNQDGLSGDLKDVILGKVVQDQREGINRNYQKYTYPSDFNGNVFYNDSYYLDCVFSTHRDITFTDQETFLLNIRAEKEPNKMYAKRVTVDKDVYRYVVINPTFYSFNGMFLKSLGESAYSFY